MVVMTMKIIVMITEKKVRVAQCVKHQCQEYTIKINKMRKESATLAEREFEKPQ